MGYPSSIFYTLSTVLFHKYGGENVGVANCMSQFVMFAQTKSNVELDNGNMVYDQVIGIILCHFPICPIIYPVGPVYYFPGQPSNTISPGDLKCYVGFQKVIYEPLEHCDFFTLKFILLDRPNRLGTIYKSDLLFHILDFLSQRNI